MKMSDPELIAVWINCPDKTTADRIAEGLVAARLAACANIYPEIESQYHWQGAVERASEVPVMVKTRSDLFDRLAARVSDLHPYEVPAIYAAPLTHVNAAYRDWLIAETATA